MTSTINFIDSVIRNLKPENKRVVYWCIGCPGFGIRVTPSGKKTFVYKYMSGRKSRWLTIGKYPEWSIRKARSAYDDYYEQVNEYGRDPVEEIKNEKIEENNQQTVSQFLEVYLESCRLKGKVDVVSEENAFKRDMLPLIGDHYLKDVTPDDIDKIQHTILERAKKKNKEKASYAPQSGKAAVYHTIAYVRQFFNLAKKKRLIPDNPVDGIEPLGAIAIRERVLSFEEIWLFWHRIEEVGIPPVTAKLLKFMLATMQRGKEVRNMKYAAFKEKEQIWHIEIRDTKNRTMHRVPLNRFALELIEEVKPYTSASPFVFGATKASLIPEEPDEALAPYGETALSQALRKNREALEIDDFTPHDLRRSGATWITAVGLPKLYASLLLNHKDKSSDVTGQVYVQYSYDFEKRKAMNIWEFVLDQIVSCESVDDIPSLDTMRELVVESGLLSA
ncbi:MAG: site-specific integrase [Gammaproteobacteria bacterium]|nr:site-specific integrase [Pseudomonadales bacterium]